jgi:hypothetical protein
MFFIGLLLQTVDYHAGTQGIVTVSVYYYETTSLAVLVITVTGKQPIGIHFTTADFVKVQTFGGDLVKIIDVFFKEKL